MKGILGSRGNSVSQGLEAYTSLASGETGGEVLSGDGVVAASCERGDCSSQQGL